VVVINSKFLNQNLFLFSSIFFDPHLVGCLNCRCVHYFVSRGDLNSCYLIPPDGMSSGDCDGFILENVGSKQPIAKFANYLKPML
jgi:hypothetical protein